MTNNLSKTKATYTHKVVCSVCFRAHFLNPAGDNLHPVRHGFHIVGGHGQGHAGSWHTGPCAGVGFPHFGHSTEGTVWALGEIKGAIKRTQKALADLEARPNLSWTFQPQKYVPATWQNRKSSYVPDPSVKIERMLAPGTEGERVAYRQEGITYDQHVNVPSYEQELTKRITDVKAQLNSLEVDRDMYQEAIKTWKPAAPVPAKTVKVVHKQIDRELADGRKFSFARCNRRYKAGLAPMTTNDADVTCQRCKH